MSGCVNSSKWYYDSRDGSSADRVQGESHAVKSGLRVNLDLLSKVWHAVH